jgi:adenylate cyclase
MDAAPPSLSFASLAETLLDHRLAQPDLARRGDGEDDLRLRRAFRALAEVFGLDHAVAAGQPPRQMLLTVIDGLMEATQATSYRIVLKSEEAGLFVWQSHPAGQETLQIERPAGITANVVADGRARAFAGIAGEGGSDAALDAVGGTRPLSLAAVPLKRGDGTILGALQLFDKRSPPFDGEDLALATTVGGPIAELVVTAGLLPWLAEGVRLVPRSTTSRDGADTADRELVLSRILTVALDILSADRGWIFLYDPLTDELYTTLSEGLGNRELRIGLGNGIAGAAYRTGELVNIADGYQDPRFNPAIDWQIGYRTRSILCAPIFSAAGARIGVVQVVNKRHGTFDAADENHLKSLASQMGVTLDYTVLFEQILHMKSHNESMLRSLTNGVLTIDMRGEVTFVNPAALAILRRSEEGTLGAPLTKVFGEMNAWILEAIDEVANGRAEKQMPNSEFYIEEIGEFVSANLAILPLLDARQVSLGFMLVIENLERERELRRTMSRYLSNEVIDRLIQDSGEALGGTAQIATTLFSDIRDFTALSESLGAAGTVSMLNEYFSYMEDVLTNRSGIIDKYVGDAVMAVFGLPFPSAGDAQNGVQAACDMLQVLELLNQRRAAASEGLIRIGIGVATGSVIAGNIGSPKRMDFTVIGDPVNLASRIESLTKLYGVDILVCEETKKRLTTTLKMRRIDVVRVRGQSRPTALYEVLEHRAAQGAANLDEATSFYENGLDAYLAGDWVAALARFETSLRLRQDDKAAQLMIERCNLYRADPPKIWDGVSLSATA